MAEEEQSKTVKNKVTIEETGPCKKKVVVEIPEETIKKSMDEQYGTLGKDADVHGFRKGRAPRRLLEKRFGKEVTEQVKLKLLGDASDASLKDNQINVLREPVIDFENIELPDSGPLKFDFEVEVRPEFDLPELEGISLNKTKLEVTDKQVDSEIMQLQKYSGVWTPRDGEEVELNDQVIADTIIKVEDIDGEDKLNNIEVHVRPEGFVGSIPVEKLDELLIGAKAGDCRKTTIEVPKTYFKEEYRGKKVDIQIDVKDIKWLKPAELNEDLFKRLGVEDEKDLRGKISDTLHGRLEQQSKQEMTEQVYKYVLDNTSFELPTEVVADQSASLLKRQYVNLLQQGLQREQIDEQMEHLKAGSEEQAKEQLKTFFIMDKIADKLDINVSEEEINGYIAQLAIQQGQRPERMREEMVRSGSLSQTSLQLRENKVIAKLLESAKIKETKPKKETKKTKKAKNTVKTAKKTAGKTKKASEPKTGKKKPGKAAEKKTGK